MKSEDSIILSLVNYQYLNILIQVYLWEEIHKSYLKPCGQHPDTVSYVQINMVLQQFYPLCM